MHFFFFTFFMITVGYAQLSGELHESEEKAKFFRHKNVDSSRYYYDKALTYTRKESPKYYELLSKKAGTYLNYGVPQKVDSIMQLIDTVKLFQIPGENVHYFNNLSAIAYEKGNYEQAIQYDQRSLKILEKEPDHKKLAVVLSNLSTDYIAVNDLDKAIEVLKKAIAIEPVDSVARMNALTNLTHVYIQKDKPAEIIKYGKMAEQLAIALNAGLTRSIIYSNTAIGYAKTGNYDQAFELLLLSNELKKQANSNDFASNYNTMAHICLDNKEYEKAKHYFLQALDYARVPFEKQHIFGNLVELSALLGSWKDTKEYFDSYKRISDSINTLNYDEKVTELSTKFETEKKEKQIALLHLQNQLRDTQIQKQRSWIWTGSLVFILLLGLGFTLYYQSKTKNKLEQATLQQRFLQTQLNPHFVFNALTSIQGFIYQNKKEESVGYIGNFSNLMRSILESSDRDFISLGEDIEAIQQYLALQRMHHSFSYTIDIDETLDQINIKVPPMFSQPFVENALIHGIRAVENGNITIGYTKHENNLIIRISDNGIGMYPSKSNTEKLNRSMGLDILRERINSLKKLYGYRISFNTTSSHTGTIVTLRFPLQTFNEPL